MLVCAREKDKTGTRGSKCECVYVRIEGTILNRRAREDLPEKVTFEQTSKECKRALG